MQWSILLYELETSTLERDGIKTGSLRNVVLEATAKVETTDRISNEKVLRRPKGDEQQTLMIQSTEGKAMNRACRSGR